MNELQVFRNSEFGELGVLEIDGKVYFPATACAKVLGYVKPNNAVKQHCKPDYPHSLKQSVGVQTGIKADGSPAMRQNEINFINEGNLYRLIVSSKLPAAEKFEHWVFDEVLPSIRKQGSYGALNIEELVTKITTAVITNIIPIIITAINENKSEVKNLKSVMDIKFSNRCKLDTFPSELREQVDHMISDMQQQQAFNYSMIARFCTINGYPISSPAVKRYFDRYLSCD